MGETVGTRGSGPESNPIDAVFASLANRERRRLVGVMAEQAPDSVPREELATELAAVRETKPREGVTEDERQEAAISLHHSHLPKLVSTGLVERDTEDDTVALADHPALQDPGILDTIEGDGADPESLDALFGAIADERRRTILDVLSHQFSKIHVETLARELATYDRAMSESEASLEDVDRILARLCHVDLPQLAEAELIRYDAEAETVAYDGHPQLTVPWIHSVFQPAFRPSLTGESNPGGIGEIEGREQVISFGQSLCERADEEIFCMFTDTQLLEAGCLTRIRDASHRGVNVYLGTRDPDIREYVRETAPDVVLWEPNADWLNLPVAGDRVGRLLLADREAVMLGTLLEEATDGLHEEQSIIGEGAHNTLVTMICQLLAPRLEEIDEGAEDVDIHLPL